MQQTSVHHPISRRQPSAQTALAFVVAALLAMNAGIALASEEDSLLQDAMLQAQVRLALLTELGFDSLDVEITANDGNVALSGTVDQRQTRELSKSVAESVEGVGSVKNDIHLKDNHGDDTAIAGAVEELERETQDGILENKVKLKLMQEIGINAFDIDVEASDGKVVLTGDTDAKLDDDEIVEIVSSINGVTDVANRVSSSA